MRHYSLQAESGKWKVQCDQCGFDYKSDEVKLDWQGFYKCRTCWERRHPQDFVRGITDDTSTPFSRPASGVRNSTTIWDSGSTEWDNDNTLWDKESTTDLDGILFVSDQDVDIDSDSEVFITYKDPLTANRTVNIISDLEFYSGNRLKIRKNDGTNFSISVFDKPNSTTIKTLSVDSSVVVEFTGSFWQTVYSWTNPL